MGCNDPYRARQEGEDAARYGRRYDYEHEQRTRYPSYGSCDYYYTEGYEDEIRRQDRRREEEEREREEYEQRMLEDQYAREQEEYDRAMWEEYEAQCYAEHESAPEYEEPEALDGE